MEVNGCRRLFGYQHSSKYLILCWVSTGEWWQNYHFGMNYPFKLQNNKQTLHQVQLYCSSERELGLDRRETGQFYPTDVLSLQ